MRSGEGRIGIRKWMKSINSLNHIDATATAGQQMFCANKKLSPIPPTPTKHTPLACLCYKMYRTGTRHSTALEIDLSMSFKRGLYTLIFQAH